MEPSKPLVLITGVSGYLASHVTLVFLKAGYRVRGTVRSLKDTKRYLYLKDLIPEKAIDLEFCEADLLNPASWLEATNGCEYVIHTASPIPKKYHKDENIFIKPAVEGTKAILEACLKNGIKKVVFTSSLAAIAPGHYDKICTEQDWSEEINCSAYEKSKLRAEKALWEFHEKHKGKIDITSINPGYIIGPVLSANESGSSELIIRLMNGRLPIIPKLSFPIADVRETALAHLKALECSRSDGQRYIIGTETIWTRDIVNIVARDIHFLLKKLENVR